MIDFIKRAIRKLVFNNPTLSYSQAGEDVVVMHLLNDIGIKQIKYLDIGANKPHLEAILIFFIVEVILVFW